MYTATHIQEFDPAAMLKRSLSLRKGVFLTPCTSKSLSFKKGETFAYKLSKKSLVIAQVIIWGTIENTAFLGGNTEFPQFCSS